MKNALLYIALLYVVPAMGQHPIKSDTISIKEVTINQKTYAEISPGYKAFRVDSSVIINYSHGSVAELLSENSLISVKSYGMGGAATPSIRGTGANHTQIAWNGISIYNPMLGQVDLSLLPAGMIDEVNIFYGGASMALNIGGIGGIVNLVTKPEWKKETRICINPGVGSFEKYSGLFSVKTGDVNFQSITKTFFQTAENDFRYLNDEISSVPVWETRKNSQIKLSGLIQELYYRRSSGILSGRLWFQTAARNLPSSMLSEQNLSNEKQIDESLRLIVSYDIKKHSDSYFFTGAWMKSNLNYTNRMASIDSRNTSDIITLKAGSELKMSEKLLLRADINEEMTIIRTNNYENGITRNVTSLTALIKYDNFERVSGTVLLREIIKGTTLFIPDFTTGLQFRIIDSGEYYLRANFSRNSRLPSLNDMFWVPGGNPDLKNEYAYIYELTYSMSEKIAQTLELKSDLSLFRNSIKDMIQWHPGANSYWTADNLSKVNTMGLESSLSLSYKLERFMAKMNCSYSFTKAAIANSYGTSDAIYGKQLMYIPKHQANISLSFLYKGIYCSWLADYTGEKYITIDNSDSLPGYLINNVTAGKKIKIKASLLDFSINVNNLFNTDYQTIAHYPLPLRSYNFKILFLFKK